jgi:cleavage and polyadenylation specificity factor subunit 3
LFEAWCTDKKNGVVIAGYCVEGTLAKQVLSQPQEVTTLGGQRLPLRMSVNYITFAAHVDYQQSREFVLSLKPSHLVLVHGEQNEMNRLKSALERELESEGVSSTQIYNPRNTQSVELHFKGEKVAKMVGKLVGEDLKSGQHVSGVLSKRGFKYHLMDSTEVSGVYFTHALIILPPTPSTSPPLS